MNDIQPLTDAELQAIRERAEKATEGPWESVMDVTRKNGPLRADVQQQNPVREIFKTGQKAGQLRREWHRNVAIGILFPACLLHDAEFIAHARTDIPRLLAEIDRLKALVKEYPDHWTGFDKPIPGTEIVNFRSNR